MKLLSLVFSLAATTATCDPNSNTNPPQPVPLISNCQTLTAQEQTFATSLSAMHQMVFCSCFGADQRAQAMGYISAGGVNKTTGMTNDMAVEMALKNCRGMQTPPNSSPMMQPMDKQQNATTPTPSKKRSPCSKN